MKNFILILIAASIVILIAFSCKTKPAPNNIPDDIAKDQLLILLKPDAKAKVLATSFSDYEMKPKGQASRSENRWVFTFNSSLISVDKLLEKVKANSLVLETDYVKITTKF